MFKHQRSECVNLHGRLSSPFFLVVIGTRILLLPWPSQGQGLGARKREVRITHQGSQSSRGDPHNATPSKSRVSDEVPATNRAPDSAHPLTSSRRYVLTAVADPPVKTIRTVSEFRFSNKCRGASTVRHYPDKLLTICESFLENRERSL